MIMIDLQIAYVDTLSCPNPALPTITNVVFTSYFTLELILKLIGYGVRGYFRSYSNIWDHGLLFRIFQYDHLSYIIKLKLIQ